MSKKKLKQLDEMIKEILNVSHDAIVVSDNDMKIIYVNDVAIELFGYYEEEMIGMKILNLLPERKKENYIMDEQKILVEKVTISNVVSGEEFFAKKKDGTEFSIELTWINWEGRSKNLYNIAQIRDITKRKSFEKELRESNATIKILNECNKALIDSIDENDYFKNICDNLVDFGGYKIAWIGLIKHDEIQSIEPLTYTGLPIGHFENEIAIKGRMSWKFKGDSSTGPTARAVNQKSAVVCNNILTDPKYESWRKEAKKRGYNSQISLPLVVDEDIVAILIILSENPDAFQNKEIKFLEELSNDISFGIKSLRLKKAQKEIEANIIKNEIDLIQLNKLLLVTSECNKALTKSINAIDYLQSICEILVEKGGNTRSIFQKVYHEDSNIYTEGLALCGEDLGSWSLEFVEKRTIKGLSGSCIIERRPIVYQNIKQNGNYVYWDKDPDKVLFQSTVAIPLFEGNVISWVLRVYSKDQFAFGSRELALLKDLSNDIVYGLSTFKTKNEKFLTEVKLSESEEKYKILFQNSNDAIFLADSETGSIIDANEKAVKMLGVALDDIIGMHQTKLHPKGEEARYKELFESHIASKHKIDQFYVVDSTGKHIPVHVSASTIVIGGRKIIQGIFRDISETKRKDEKLRQSQKMEALGTLSGGIAHDFNNILSPIIGYSELAIIEKDSNKVSKYLNEILSASNRAKSLVSQILTFCRKGESEMKPFRLQPIIKEALKLIKISLPSNIEMEINIDQDCGAVLCDPTQIHQVVMNLCTNAYHSMKEKGGKLNVSLLGMDSKDIRHDIIEEVKIKNYLCLTVEDTGTGMTKSVMERIFEPYFTTKGKDEGTGLGLSVVLGIIKAHGGDIYVRSYPGEGSYFKVILPLLEYHARDEKVENTDVIKGKKERIMVIDDEKILCEIVSAILNDLGYVTTTFNSSLVALEEFKKDPYKFDLIFTDQTMPGMVGSELAKKILKIRNDIPIILATGYSPLISKEDALNLGIKDFIMKPFTRSSLANAVGAVFEKSKAVKG
ncbi:MAG: PAS domain S-box protein [Candidatus Delongbacteria bacterium]|nr:PAS domain S-box protein [Candidatus Delongbacteria bacterium]